MQWEDEWIETADDIRNKMAGRMKGEEKTEGSPFLIAIDGRCASGKTTLSGCLQELLGCPVIHMDHFFPRPHQRTEERLSQPGGNVDYERFQEEVLAPLRKGEAFSYRPYLCQEDRMGEPVFINAGSVCILEGSYSCHPLLYRSYNLTVFLDVGKEEQMKRIRLRNGEEKARQFARKWIPLEENYFSACRVRENCDLYFFG